MTPTVPPARRARRAALAILASVTLGVLLLASPAGAHGGEAVLSVTDATRSGEQVALTVSFTFASDGHGVPDATVTVVVDDQTPVAMTTAEEGIYSATVTAAPGALLRITAVDPATSIEVAAPPAEETPTTAAGTTDGATPEPATTEAAGSTSSPTTLPGATSVLVEDGTAAEEDDTVLVLAGITAAVGAVGALCIVMLLRSRKLSSDSPGEAPSDDDPEA